jgi:hypothetical protein
LEEETLDETTMSRPAVPGPGGVEIAPHPVSYVTRKLPHVTLVFWVLKIAATTLGETGGDLLAQTLKVGYLTSTLIFFAMFLVLQPHLVMFDVLSLVVACAGVGLVASAPGRPVLGV